MRQIGSLLLAVTVTAIITSTLANIGVADERGTDTSALSPVERESPIPGLREIAFGSQILLVSPDKRYAIAGNRLIDLETGLDLTELSKQRDRLRLLNDFDSNAYVSIHPHNASLYRGYSYDVIYAFLSLDCGYCHAFFAEAEQLMQSDFEIRVILIGNPDSEKLWSATKSVLCSDDSAQELARRFASGPLEVAPDPLIVDSGNDAFERSSCDVIAEMHLALSAAMEIRWTPTFIFETGRVVHGHTGIDWLIENGRMPPEPTTVSNEYLSDLRRLIHRP